MAISDRQKRARAARGNRSLSGTGGASAPPKTAAPKRSAQPAAPRQAPQIFTQAAGERKLDTAETGGPRRGPSIAQQEASMASRGEFPSRPVDTERRAADAANAKRFGTGLTPAAIDNVPNRGSAASQDRTGGRSSADIVKDMSAARRSGDQGAEGKFREELRAFRQQPQQEAAPTQETVRRSPSVVTSREADRVRALQKAELDRMRPEQLRIGFDRPDAIDNVSGRSFESDFEREAAQANQDIDNELLQTNALFDSIQEGVEADLAGDISQIRSGMERRREEERKSNDTQQRVLTQAGIRSGRQRFAGEVQAGIMSAAESALIQNLADIDARESSLILEAKSAARNKDLQLMAQRLGAAKEARKEKRGVLKELREEGRIEEQLQRQRLDDQRREIVFEQQQDELVRDTAIQNAGLFAGSLVGIGPSGEIEFASEEDINLLADQLGVNPALLKSSMNERVSELNKLDLDERKFQLEVIKAEGALLNKSMTNDIKNFQFAQDQGFTGNILEFQQAQSEVKRKPEALPKSYQEWQLAGGLQGTGKSYSGFISTQKAQGKPPTASQGLAAGFANRVEQALDIFKNIEGEVIPILTGTTSGLFQRELPSFLQKSIVQQQEQAERNFVNAVLRRESGAAIAPSEFESATKQYFPQPGDKEAVLSQKKLNRQQALQNLILDSGTAYSPTSLLGESALRDPNIQPQQDLVQDLSVDIGIFGSQNPDKIPIIEQLMRDGRSERDIADIMGLDRVGGDTNIASPTVERNGIQGFATPEGLGSAPTVSMNGMFQVGKDAFKDLQKFAANCVFFARGIVGSIPTGAVTVPGRIEGLKKAESEGFGGFNMNNASVGNAIHTSEGNVGHTAVISGIDGDDLILTEANYKSGKITAGRRINRHDPKILGWISPKNQFMPDFSSRSQIAKSPKEGTNKAIQSQLSRLRKLARPKFTS